MWQVERPRAMSSRQLLSTNLSFGESSAVFGDVKMASASLDSNGQDPESVSLRLREATAGQSPRIRAATLTAPWVSHPVGGLTELSRLGDR